MRRPWARAEVLIGAGLTCVLAAEFAHRHASYGEAAVVAARGSTESIVVLGYPSRRGARLHPVQRWRVEIAVRSLRSDTDTQLIFTGASVGDRSEAVVMAAYARDRLGVPADRIVVESRARSTWQNVEFSLPLVRHDDVITFASDPLHAARARRYLLSLWPDLAPRIGRADDYRFLERWWLKVPTAGYELLLQARPQLPAERRGDA